MFIYTVNGYDPLVENDCDILIIGGGATGFGIGIDAISRGYRVILIDNHDFGSGASSKSTKLVHGGIRYLSNFDFKMVKNALQERQYFLTNAPHISSTQGFLIPFYSINDLIKYSLGVKLYDYLAKDKLLKKSQIVSKKKVINLAPNIKTKGLIGGIIYYDGQFDDSRMIVSLLKTFIAMGGKAYNYHTLNSFIYDDKHFIRGAVITDNNNPSEDMKIFTGAVVNATGAMARQLLELNRHSKGENIDIITVSQGSHLIFDQELFNLKHALVIPKTSDGRIIFAVPWHDKVIVGTTDIQVHKGQIEPRIFIKEIDFLLDTINQYTNRTLSRKDIKSVFTGQRPLVHSTKLSKYISREHKISISRDQLVSVVGGKWTTYRQMGEDTVDFIINHNLIPQSKPSATKNLALVDASTEKLEYPLSVYGKDHNTIIDIQKSINNFNKLHAKLPYYIAEVVYQVRHEMVKTVEDVLARRTRALYIDARAAIEAAPLVARIIAQECRHPRTWEKRQVTAFTDFAYRYLIT